MYETAMKQFIMLRCRKLKIRFVKSIISKQELLSDILYFDMLLLSQNTAPFGLSFCLFIKDFQEFQT